MAESRPGLPDADLAALPAVKICGVTRLKDALVADHNDIGVAQ